MAKEEKTACRTPAAGRDGVTNIPTWKFDLLRRHILDIVGQAGDTGFAWKDLSEAVGGRLTGDELARLGNVGWHTVTVKLELEVRGELRRLDGAGPQLLVVG